MFIQHTIAKVMGGSLGPFSSFHQFHLGWFRSEYAHWAPGCEMYTGGIRSSESCGNVASNVDREGGGISVVF